MPAKRPWFFAAATVYQRQERRIANRGRQLVGSAMKIDVLIVGGALFANARLNPRTGRQAGSALA